MSVVATTSAATAIERKLFVAAFCAGESECAVGYAVTRGINQHQGVHGFRVLTEYVATRDGVGGALHVP